MATVDIKLGYTCNNNCRHCVIADQREHALDMIGKEDLSTEEFKREILKSRKRGFTSIIFTGGEPTIRKDFLELLDYASFIGFRVNIQTNGRMLYYPEFAEKVAAYKPHLVIALHSHDPETHDSITRAKGSFDQTVKGLRNTIKHTQDITGKVVISKKNQHQLKKIAELFHDIGIRKAYYAFPHAQGNAWKYFNEIVPRYSEILEEINSTIEYCNSKGMHVEFEAFPYCTMPGKEMYIAEKHPRSYTELKQVGSRQLDWDQVRIAIKKKFPQCRKCIHDSICEGPWEEYPQVYGDDEFQPITITTTLEQKP